MNKKIKAVIFDMDGLIIDSEPLWKRAEIEAFGSIGYDFTYEMCESTKGMRIDEVVGYWHSQLKWSSPSISHVVNDITDRMIKLIRSEGAPLPGVLKTISKLTDRKIPLALASSSSMKLIQTVLNKLKIQSYFEVVHSAEFEEKGKPDPQVFLTTAKKLGLEPSSCLVLEDSKAGMEAGINAGMRVVLVPDRLSPVEKWHDKSYCVLNTLNEFDMNLVS
ncbi:MAG: hexitol phosphatase HxpB [Bacteroidota bacterium]|nr:hexitol phosphatase HxpB [Bacteroidota bacterium]